MSILRLLKGVSCLATLVIYLQTGALSLPLADSYSLSSFERPRSSELSSLFSEHERHNSASDADRLDQLVDSYMDLVGLTQKIRDDDVEVSNSNDMDPIRSYLPKMSRTEDDLDFSSSSMEDGAEVRDLKEKRQQGWHTKYGKRNGQLLDKLQDYSALFYNDGFADVDSDKYSSSVDENVDEVGKARSRLLLADLMSKFSNFGADSRSNTDSLGALEKPSSFTDSKSLSGPTFSKRQQGWHIPYGKRSGAW